MKPDPGTVALLADLLAMARRGEITEAFCVFRNADGEADHGYNTTDLPDLLLQVRTEVIRAQLDQASESAGLH